MANQISVEVAFELEQAIKSLRKIEKATEKFGKEAKANFGGATQAVNTFAGTLASAGVQRILGSLVQGFHAVNEAVILMDTAMIGVAKTTGASAKDIKLIEKEIRKLSRTTPIAADELANLAKVGGQLGVRGVKNITKFTDVISKLSVATNLVGEEGASAILKVLNVTGEGVDKIENFGSAVTFLGNNFNVTESQIVSGATRIAASLNQFNISSADAAALSTVLGEMGIQAERASSVLGRSFLAIGKAINDEGSVNFQRLINITGLTGEALKETFADAPVKVFASFIQGLKNMGGAAGTISAELEKFGLTGVRINDVIPTMAKNAERLTMVLDASSTAFAKNTALAEEAAIAFGSLASKTKLAQNSLDEISRLLGEKFTPAWIELKLAVAGAALAMTEEFSRGQAAAVNDINLQVERLTETLKRQRSAAAEAANAGDGFWSRLFGTDLDAQIAKVNETQAEIDRLIKRRNEIAGDEGKSLADITQGGDSNNVVTQAQKEASDKAAIEAAASAKRNALLKTELEEKAAIKAEFDKNEQESKELIELEAKDRRAAREELGLEEEAEKRELSIQQLTDNLGQEDALREATEIKKLEREGKFAEAKQKKVKLQKKNEKASAFEQQKFEELTNKQKVANLQSTFGQIATLQSSSSSELAAIGKAAAIAQATISGIQAVNVALASAPPPINFALATLVGVAAAANVAKIASTKSPGRQDGGIVGGASSISDNQLVPLAGGELVLNKPQQTELFNNIASGNLGGGGGSISINIQSLTGDIPQSSLDNLIEQIRDAQQFNNSQSFAS